MGVKSLSYSEMWLFKRSKDRWYKRYVQGLEEPTSPEATLGKIVHEILEKGPGSYKWEAALKENGLEHKTEIVRTLVGKMAMKTLEGKEMGMSATLKLPRMAPIQLFGFMDGIDISRRILAEYKTSESDERWNQRIADQTIQLSFYALMFKLNYHAFFSDIQLHYLNTARGTVETFHTARGPEDLKKIVRDIEDMVRWCRQHNLWEARISRENRAQKKMAPLFPEPLKEITE